MRCWILKKTHHPYPLIVQPLTLLVSLILPLLLISIHLLEVLLSSIEALLPPRNL
jgi:hypothetical protein